MRAKPITALQVLERHRLDQRRFPGAGLPGDVEVRKAVFVFDAERALIISKIDPPNVYDIVFVHPIIVAISDTRARDEVLPRNGIHALTISPDSSI
jgi:hypothetical protein